MVDTWKYRVTWSNGSVEDMEPKLFMYLIHTSMQPDIVHIEKVNITPAEKK